MRQKMSVIELFSHTKTRSLMFVTYLDWKLSPAPASQLERLINHFHHMMGTVRLVQSENDLKKIGNRLVGIIWSHLFTRVCPAKLLL